jgi:polyhydroxyalkanoate synthase
MNTATKTSTLDTAAWGRWLRLISGETRTPIGQSKKQMVFQRDRLTVYRYERDTPAAYKPPVLLVYSLINRPTVMDLLPNRSLVQNLLAGGFDVYLLDWGIPDALDQALDLEVYVDVLLHSVVREVCKQTGYPAVTVLGYCMGGSLSAMYTALHPQRVRNLVMLGAPVCFRSNELLYKWGCDPKTFSPSQLTEAYGNAPPWAFEGFNLLRAEGKLHRWSDLYDKIDDETFLENYLAMDEWVSTNIPLAGAIYAEFVEKCFQQDELLTGRLEIGGRRVNLRNITCPTLVIAGSADNLVPPETACPLREVVANTEEIVFPAGHIGLSVGRAANTKLWPQACAWMARNSEAV